MADRPILFNDAMVRAILAGTKTQTRRIAKPKRSIEPMTDECPYGLEGDRLWVREAWARDDEDGCLMYRADVGSDVNADAWEHGRREGVPRYRWRPSIHMPRWASRITIEVTAVRVERLQEISPEDCSAEGIPLHHVLVDSRRATYADLWESINGPGSWDANPWVWVIEFRRNEALDGR